MHSALKVNLPPASARSAHKPRQRGFTLMELMIAVVVVGLLASLVYPSFAAQVNRGRVGKAISDIKSIEVSLERYYTERNGYPNDLSEIASGLLDPWGHPYQYLNMQGATTGQVRKDKSLHPLNTDYDLCSMGADGRTATPLTAKASQDDIVRASNGGFVGLASAF